MLWNKINASIKRRNQRGAPQRSVLSQIEESGLLSQKSDSFLKRGVSFLKGWACSETTSRTPDFKRSICPDVLSLVTCNWQLCGNYGQLCQKARNLYYSSIHRLPTMSEGIVPVVKKSPISIYLRLPQQRHTLSALLHLRECISNTPSQVTLYFSFPGIPLQTTHPEQKYFIS